MGHVSRIQVIVDGLRLLIANLAAVCAVNVGALCIISALAADEAFDPVGRPLWTALLLAAMRLPSIRFASHLV